MPLLARQYSIDATTAMQPFDFQPKTRVVFRDGGLSLLGELARSLGFTRTLIVADPGMQAAGLVGRLAEGVGSLDVQVSRVRRQSGFCDGQGGTAGSRRVIH